jgi:hypothetical protein
MNLKKPTGEIIPVWEKKRFWEGVLFRALLDK